jgi:hypothetical protein
MTAPPFSVPLVILAEHYAETNTRLAITLIAKLVKAKELGLPYLSSRRTGRRNYTANDRQDSRSDYYRCQTHGTFLFD